MFLGSASTADLRGFSIYVHEKDQFWPGLEMEQIGQPNSLYIPAKTELHSSFTVRKKINLPTDSTPCVTDSNYKYTICMRNYVTRTAGCHLDWVDNTTLTNRIVTRPFVSLWTRSLDTKQSSPISGEI